MRCKQPSVQVFARQLFDSVDTHLTRHCKPMKGLQSAKLPLARGCACLVVDGSQRCLRGRVRRGCFALGGRLAHGTLLRRLVVV